MAADRAPRGWRLVGRYGLLVVVATVVLFPIYTTLLAAFKPGSKVLHRPLLPDAFTFQAIGDAWTDGHLGRYLLNSAVVAIAVTVFQVVTSLLSGYAFAMLDFPGRNALFIAFLATLLVPLEATLVVNRRTVDSLGWLNSYPGLAVPPRSARSSSDRRSSAYRASCATRPASTAPGTSRSCATWRCR
jgi:sn-glycerol 3-phosphate transport system permease protein